jgi:hypothetical protein
VTLADIAMRVFEKAFSYGEERARRGVVANTFVTREDFERAVIALQFRQMELTTHQLDELRAIGMLELQQAQQRAHEGGEFDVTVVEPDGTEEFRPVFTPRKDDDGKDG